MILLRSWGAIWDVTAPRILALVGRVDLLLAVTGLTVPRIVANPSDATGDDLLDADVETLSELAAAERYFRRRHYSYGDPADYDRAVRLANLRQHPDLRVVDLSDEENDDMMVLSSPGFQRRMGHTIPLGRGERAAIAVAANREWIAGVDDATAREAAHEWGVRTMTTQDLLRASVAEGEVSEDEAKAVNADMLAEGFFGDTEL